MYFSLHRSCTLSPELLTAEKHLPISRNEGHLPNADPTVLHLWGEWHEVTEHPPAKHLLPAMAQQCLSVLSWCRFKTFNLKIFICPSLSRILDFYASHGDFQNFVRKAVLRNPRLMPVLEVLNTLMYMYRTASLLWGKKGKILGFGQVHKEHPLQSEDFRSHFPGRILALTNTPSCATWCWQLSVSCTEM